MLFKLILDAIRTAIAKAVERTTADAVEAGVAKGIQTGLEKSFGEGFKLTEELQTQIDAKVQAVPGLLSAEQHADRVLIEDSTEKGALAPSRKPSARRKRSA